MKVEFRDGLMKGERPDGKMDGEPKGQARLRYQRLWLSTLHQRMYSRTKRLNAVRFEIKNVS